MSPMPRTKRTNGRHEPGATVPDPAEDSMTTSARKPAPAEVLEDHLVSHEAALRRVREASGALPAIEDKIRASYEAGDSLRAEAEELRRRAADADLRADNQFAAATALGDQRDQLREEAAGQQARADYHGRRIAEEIALGAEDPMARRQRLADEEAARLRAKAGPRPGLAQTPLDGPNPKLSPEPTAPFPQHPQPGVDDLQKTAAEGTP